MIARASFRAVAALGLALFAGASPMASATATSPAAQIEATLCAPAVIAIDDVAMRTLAQGSPGALVVVAHNGRTLLSAEYGLADLEHDVPLERDAVFPLASLTKMFTAAAILKLHDQGRLSLDAPLGAVLKGMPGSMTDVRIHDLLVQTSGIPDFASDPETLRTRAVARSTGDMLDLIARLSERLNFAPGTRWEYSNANYVLLGAILEQETGEDLNTAFEELLLRDAGLATIRLDDPSDVVPRRLRGYRRDARQPSGFANAAWINPSIPAAAGGLRGTASDLVRWSNALFGGRILKPETLRLMVAPGRMRDGRSTGAGMPEAWQEGLKSDYAMGLFVRSDTAGGLRLSHSGDIDGFSTWFAFYPESGVTIVQVANSESTDLQAEAVEAAVFRPGRSPCLDAGR